MVSNRYTFKAPKTPMEMENLAEKLEERVEALEKEFGRLKAMVLEERVETLEKDVRRLNAVVLPYTVLKREREKEKKT